MGTTLTKDWKSADVKREIAAVKKAFTIMKKEGISSRADKKRALVREVQKPKGN